MANARSNGRLPKFQRVMMVSAHPDDPADASGAVLHAPGVETMIGARPSMR